MKHQIYGAQKQGYSEDEIVSGPIRSMHSGFRLNSILNMKSSSLALATLMEYLQHHYEEKCFTDLFAHLTQ